MNEVLLSEVFLKIINMSISASWLVLAVLLLRLVLKKAPKWVSVLLWGFVAVRLICPFSIESVLSLIPSAETVSPEIMMDWTPEISTGIGSVDTVINPIITQTFAPNPATSANPLQILIPVAGIFWLAGIAAMLVYTAVSYFLLRRRVATAVLFRNNIYQSENVDSPFVLGIIKPKIYLPFQMDGKNLEHVIAHEESHIRRKDHWWKPFGFVLLALHWFNPLMWLGYILLCRDIELACDEKVIKEMDNEAKADYTQALVACSINRRSIAACPLAFGEVGVKERVKSVMNYKKPTFWIIIAAIVTCIAVAVCFLTNPVAFQFDEESNTIVSANYFDMRNADDAGTVEMNSAQLSELSSRLAGVKNTRKNDEYGGLTPAYQISACLKNGTYIRISGYSMSDNDKVDIAWGGKRYVVFDTDFQDYLNRICLGMDISSIVSSDHSQLRATVLEVHDSYLLVAPEGGTPERSVADKIEVSLKERESWPIPQVGDAILVVYDGNIQETYPARITNVYRVEIQNFDSGPIETVYGNLKTYYKNTNGTWQVDGRNYQYRLVITGRMNNAAVDSTFVYLSNLETITFDQAWKAAGLSSNKDDYFSVEDAVLVEWLSGGTKKMTLTDVIELSKLGMDLTWEDLKAYKGEEIGSGLYIVKYEIDPEFYLAVGDGKTTGKPMYVSLNAVSNGASCDIRESDVEAFITENQSDALDYAIHKAVIEHNADGTFPDFPNGFIPTQVHYIYGIETVSGTPAVGQLNHMEETTVYVHYVYSRYLYTNGELTKAAGNATPAKLTFSVDPEKGYTLKEFWEPNGGNVYAEEIRANFPKEIADIVLDPQSDIVDTEKMEQVCFAKVQEYISSLTD